MAIVKKIVVGTPLRPVRIIGASVDSSSVRRLIDSAYINSHLDDTLFLDSAEAISLIDSAYIQARQAVNTTDSATITNIIDSAYVNAKLDTTLFLDSSEATALIDSAYILARASNIQNLRDSGSDTIITGALLPATDSAQDLGSPTRKFKDLYLSGSTLYIGNVAIGTDSDDNVKIFTLDGAGNIQSTRGKIALLDAADSDDDILGKVDSDYVSARVDRSLFLDSSEVIQLVDSNYVASRTFTQTQIEDFARAVSLDSAETIALIDSAYVLARGIQNIVDSGSDLVISGSIIPDTDSAYSLGSADKKFTELYLSGNTIFLGGNTISVDSSNDFRIRNSAGLLTNLVADHLHLGTDKKKLSVDANNRLRFTNDNLATNYGFNLEANSITDLSDVDSGAVAGQFLRWNGTQFVPFDVDSAYVAARTWTQPDIEAFARDVSLDSAEAKVLIDSAVNALVDGAPAALDTLNELAAALNDDSNAYGSLTALINSKLTSTQFDTLFDSALGTKTTDDVTEGVNNLYYTDTRVETFVDSFVDSAYINSRLNADLFLDSSEVLTLIDSDYITARASTFDSASALALIDSAYIEARQSSENLTLGTVTDGSLTDGAIQTLTPDTKIVDAIDELNEAMLNVSNNTFVRSVNFSGSPLAGGEGVSVTLSINPVGNANRYDVNWGDGTIDSAITDPTPTHTYSSNSGSPFNVTVRAFNNTGTGSGSSASFERISYIIVYTADPVANFAAYAAPTGGPALSFWQDGDTVYFENTTSNTTMANVTYRWTWGDGSQDIIDSDNAAGGVTGPRIGHTFTASTNTDVQRTTQLELTSHTTADPTVISGGVNVSDTFEIYDNMPTPNYVAQAVRVVNGTNHRFLLNTTGLTGLGSHSTFGNQIKHYFGDGTITTANVGSGQDGDIGDYVTKSFPLTSSNQANGVTRQIDNYVEVITNHGSSPFTSGTLSVFTEPKVVAGVTARAPTVSDGSNDDDKTVYISSVGGVFTDLNGADRTRISAIVSCQNSGNNSINFNNGENVTPTAADSTTITYNSSGWTGGAGTKNITLTASATPDTISQTDTASDTFTVKVVPTAPTKINTKSLSIATAGSGTFPRLAYGYSNNGGQTNLAGFNLENSGGNGSSTRITTQNWQTNDVENIDHQNGGFVGAFRVVNGGGQQSIGSVTTDTTLSQTGLYNQLRIVAQRDMHQADATVPSHFYKVYNLRIEGDPNDLAYGLNQITAKNNFGAPDGLIETNNRVYFIKDTGNVVTIENTGSVSEGSGAGRKYIGGVPYINSGSSSGITLSGIQVRRLTTECYTNQTNILEVDFDTNLEGSSGSSVPNTGYQYSSIVNSAQMQGSSPHAYIGQSSNYVLETVTVPVSSNVRSVGNLKIRARNANGISSYTSHSVPIRVYNASSIAGIDETNITSTVPNKNGNGVRVSGLAAAAGDTPSYTGSNNFYTGFAMNHTTDFVFQGKKEAGVSVNGLIQHDVTNYSGHLPSGPNRSGDTGNQYFTFAFRSTALQNFNINLTTSTGISGLYIALPGTGIDTSSTLNGWLDCSSTYNGSGQPGAGTGGNGSNGCAFGGEAVPTGSAINNQSYSMTFGTLSAAGSTGNNVLVRVVLASGETVSDISVSQFS
jgi:hypothetical protein